MCGPGPLLGPMLAVLGRSWDLCWRSWATPGPLWAILSRSWGLCARSWVALRAYFDGYLTPKFEGKLSEDNIDSLGGKEKLIEGESISLDDGVYQISKGYILVDGNKIIKQD